MQLGAVLKIDDFEFPLPPKESLDFVMDRAISKLDFPGGPPVYQDMGMSEKTLDFSGSFVGDDALDVNDKLESLWWSGRELQLSYGDIQKLVRIQTYRPRLLRSDRVDYSIHLVVCFSESAILDISNVDGQSFTASASTGSTSPTLQSTLDRSYTIKAGDTLWSIAAKKDVFGDGTKWEILAKGNGITNERNLQVGQTIKIPSAGNAGASQTASTAAQSAVLGTTGQSELQSIQGRAS